MVKTLKHFAVTANSFFSVVSSRKDVARTLFMSGCIPGKTDLKRSVWGRGMSTIKMPPHLTVYKIRTVAYCGGIVNVCCPPIAIAQLPESDTP